MELLEKCRKYKLNNPSNWTIQGDSVAGWRTGFLVPELKIMLDCGIASKQMVDYVFITHMHTDHTMQLINAAHQRRPPVVYIPEGMSTLIENYAKVVYDLCESKVTDHPKSFYLSDMGIRLREIGWCYDFTLKTTLDFNVEILPCCHVPGCQTNGYGFSSLRMKLKDEYKGKDIGKLRRENPDLKVSELIKIPEFAFFADSTIETLTNETAWQKYPVIIIECTGLTQNKKNIDYRSRGHIGIDELMPFIEKFNDKHWVLIHHSKATSVEDVAYYQRPNVTIVY